jgi:PilZ domain
MFKELFRIRWLTKFKEEGLAIPRILLGAQMVGIGASLGPSSGAACAAIPAPAGSPLPDPRGTVAGRPQMGSSANRVYGTPEEAIRNAPGHARSSTSVGVGEAARPGHRRAARLYAGVPVRVFASDASGRQFIEDAMAEIVSATGARIRLSRSLLTDDTITMRNLMTAIEEEFRVVGTCRPLFGTDPEYGVELLDPTSDIWGLRQTPEKSPKSGILLECGRCKSAEEAELTPIENDVLVDTGLLSRFCKRCNDMALWRPVGLDLLQPPREYAATAASAGSVERRSSERIQLNARIRVARVSGSFGFGQIVNVSRTGLQFKSRADFEVDENVFIFLPQGNSSLSEKNGRIVWSSLSADEHLYGVRYSEQQPPPRKPLD